MFGTLCTGTVFHKIKMDYEKHHPSSDPASEKRRLNRFTSNKPSGGLYNIPMNNEGQYDPDVPNYSQIDSPGKIPKARNKEFQMEDGENMEDSETSDVALSALEGKMLGWLSSESEVNP